MSKNIEDRLNVGINEYFAAESLVSLHGENIEEYDKQEITTNI